MKITKYFLSMAAAVSMIAGCYKPEMIQIAAPEDVVAPVLEAVEGPIEITPANMGLEKVTFNWSAADYGVMTQVNYSLEAAAAAAPDTKVTITSGLTATTAELTYEALNQILFNDLKLNDGVAEDVLFMVGAKVGEYEKIYSNAITVSCKVTAAEKVYPKLTVAGSYAYNNWTPGKGQFVFDFDGTDAKYSGVIDFGEDVSKLEFKFVGTAWGTNEFSVPAGEAQTAEAAELPLAAGGGDNITAYRTNRFYSLTLDKGTPKVTKNFSFNQIGVIGSFNGWAEDVVMQFNAEKQRFYADVEFAEDGQFKLRADADWTVNWGAEAFGMTVSNSDGNLEAAAGKYRIYANMNNPAEMTIELNAGMYGKEEPVAGTTTPEPEPTPTLQGWGVVGTITGWADGADLMMANDGTWYVVKGVEFGADDKFKIRLDGKWDTSFGGEFKANEEVILTSENGPDIVPAAGTYDIYFNPDNGKAWFINDGSYPGGGDAPEASEWGVVGDVNGWTAPDITMYKTATEGLFVAYNVALPDGGFKIRANGEWNDAANYGLETAGNVEVDHAYDVITGGGSANMTIVAGTYDIWFDLTNTKVYIMTPGKPISEAEGGEAVTPEPEPEPEVTDWYLVGDFNGWTAADANYKLTLDGNWYVFKSFTADGKGVKFVADANWTVNRGGIFVAAGEAIEVVHDGANLEVAAGTYDVYLSKDASVAYFMTPGEAPAAELDGTWYLVGDFNGWTAADANYKMTAENGWYVFKNFTADGKGVKFVADANWTVNRGGTFVAAGEAIEVVHDGANLEVTAGSYDVYLNADASKAYFMEAGKTPTN